MTLWSEFLQLNRSSETYSDRHASRIRIRRVAIAVLLLFLAGYPGELGELTRGIVVDAYLGVSVFVAATLLAIYGAEKLFRFDFGKLMRSAGRLEVPIAALLGVVPGCGGAVVVVAAYTAGHARFGSLVAALTATMGDAAFVLLAVRPDAAAVLFPLAFGVGVLSGWVINAINYRMPAKSALAVCDMVPRIGSARTRDAIFVAIAAPGFLVGFILLFQIEFTGPIADLPTVLGLAGASIAMFVWATSPVNAMTNKDDPPSSRTSEETSFITVWVLAAFLAYDYAVAFTGLNLEAAFDLIAPLIPLVAIFVGFIPGCGPQILVTALYISGAIPFAALIGNAISNDGDALFPAIALNPKAAVWATLVSAIPAVIVAYGFFFLAPGFLN
ncbi:MAG: arsenic efflux protein [Albidovulum sp.]|nr:arsenic efflux protein [Albidovulum sp.]MDE0307851.1 arsenic efflux protein [Albidovulum sp.]MDE0533597.1 arsenic efflux protein [Albidovulum sp.]